MPNYRQLTASNLVATAACASCGGGGGNNNITITDCVTGQQWSIDPGSFAVGMGQTYRYTRTGSGTVYCGTVTRNDNAGLKEGDIENPQAYECGDTAHCP